jgi:hypothetical protein
VNWRITNQEKGVLMASATRSPGRTTQMLALMKQGDDVCRLIIVASDDDPYGPTDGRHQR